VREGRRAVEKHETRSLQLNKCDGYIKQGKRDALQSGQQHAECGAGRISPAGRGVMSGSGLPETRICSGW
jgi:hypothetical protein